MEGTVQKTEVIQEDAASKAARQEAAKANLAKGREKRKRQMLERKEKYDRELIARTIATVIPPTPTLVNPMNPFLKPNAVESPSIPLREHEPKTTLTKYEPEQENMDVEEDESKNFSTDESEEEERPPKRKRFNVDPSYSLVSPFGTLDPLTPEPKSRYSNMAYAVGKTGILAGSTLVFFVLQYITSWGVSKVTNRIEQFFGSRLCDKQKEPIPSPKPHQDLPAVNGEDEKKKDFPYSLR